MKYFIPCLMGFLILLSCGNDPTFAPKPRVYPRIDYPIKEFVAFNNPTCPFNMKIPVYFSYKKDSLLQQNNFQNAETSFDCWFDLNSAQLNTSLHFSYIPIDSEYALDTLIAEAFEMVEKHNIKANYRDEKRVDFGEKKVHGLLFEIDGPVATPLQFFLTDSTQHFLRGSLYFNAQVNRDSIQPVYEFIKDDIAILLESFQWTPN